MKGDIVIWMSGREKITDEKWERIFGKKEVPHGLKEDGAKEGGGENAEEKQ